MRESQEAAEKRFWDALNTLVEKVKTDRNVIAAILQGSMSYDQVWEKSDIDLTLIGRDDIDSGYYTLTEGGVSINTSLIPRSEFKRGLERAQQGSFGHSAFSLSTLLFSEDESIKAWYENANLHGYGARDKKLQLLSVITRALPPLAYAEKQFYVNNDLLYSFTSILYAVEVLARVEVILNDEVPSREVIQPALKYNPDFFNFVYTDLINRQKDKTVIENALERVNAYLDDKLFIFQPVLDYLAEAESPRSITDLNTYFQTKIEGTRLDTACQWLASKGVIEQFSAPVKLTLRSQIEVEEAAYYYYPEDVGGASQPRPVGDASQPRPVGGASQPRPPVGGSSQPRPPVGGSSQPRPPVGGASQSRPVGGASQSRPVGGSSQPRPPVGGASQSRPVGGSSQPRRLKEEAHPHIIAAVAAFAEDIKEDRYILAAILTSNLEPYNVWEQTTVEITLICRDDARLDPRSSFSEVDIDGESEEPPAPRYSLVEDGVNINVTIYRRSEYKRMIEGGLQADTFHAILLRSKCLFSKDDTVELWHQTSEHIGAKDQQAQLMRMSNIFATMAKVEKWFYIKKDYDYCFLYLTFVVSSLAKIETILNGEVPKRKAIHQAVKYNPDFFNAIFIDLIDKPKTEETIGRALALIDEYLEDKALTFFQPLFEFLSEARGTRTIREIGDHFRKRFGGIEISGACEWLAQKEILELVSSPLRLTKNSRVSVEEPAYYYDADNPFLDFD